ncbi:MAG TPA: hypothetical protein VIQ03_16200 [Gammaproteobacteria bacterium]
MFDYVFFHERPFNLFVEWLKEQSLSPEVRIEDDNYEISLADDIDDELADAIEEKYDELMEMNRQISESMDQQEQGNYSMAGIMVYLKNGQVSHADVKSDLLSRIMSAISPEEFGEVVEAIVDAVENPETRSYCQRKREEKPDM